MTASEKFVHIRQLANDPNCPLTEYMIRKLIKQGNLPHLRTGKKYLIDREKFYQWLQDAHE